MAKQQLRQTIRALLKTMSREERERQSSVVFRKLSSDSRFLAAKRVGLYVSKEREIDTTKIFEFCFDLKKRVFIPKFSINSREMDLIEVLDMDDFRSLKEMDFRVKQPSDVVGRAEALSSGGLDLILVPGLGFTCSGLRLGNGFGFYDRYLKKCFDGECRPLVVGLAFTQQILNEIPFDSHDIKIDFVLFP